MTHFEVGQVSIEILDGLHSISDVPPSQWHSDRQPRDAQAVLANLSAGDGLRAQVSLVFWPENEVSLGHAEVFAGPSDYERLADAGLIAPKLIDDKLIARVRALRYGPQGRATSAATSWEQIDVWAEGNSRELLEMLGATKTGSYGQLLPDSTRFRAEPAIEVKKSDPRAMFAIYALTRVVPIMTGFGKQFHGAPNE